MTVAIVINVLKAEAQRTALEAAVLLMVAVVLARLTKV